MIRASKDHAERRLPATFVSDGANDGVGAHMAISGGDDMTATASGTTGTAPERGQLVLLSLILVAAVAFDICAENDARAGPAGQQG
jgi:hypothetical protein